MRVIQAVVGSNWDIVGFDPRGIWNSLPLANCSTHTTAKQIPTLISRFVPRVLDKYFNDWIQRGKELGVQCQNTIGGEHDIGPHMSTATVARDMLSIVDAFAQTTEGKTAVTNTSMLNYYGISYGTFLGQTFASMFPQRVGKVVLDGVVNTEGYLTNWTSNAITHIDGIIGAFFIYCHEAGLAKCPYYNGSSAADMYTRFNQSFTQLDPQKAERENWANATILQSALVTMKVGFLSIAQSPLSTFSTFASILVDLETALATQNLSSWVVKASAALGVADTNAPTDSLDEWTLGVLCSDQNNRWYNKTLEDLRPQLAYLEAQSIAGEAWSKAVLGCLGWSIKAAERFAGPFGGDTATPILFVSNTYDSVTAIEK
jgi:pimeloyl-ACP methyl ester carboxylesterase